MRKLTSLLAFSILSMPLFAAALEMDLENNFPFSGLDTFISGVVSNTIATSSSGGIVAPGAAVSGDASASAQVRTIMHSGSGGTFYKTEIRTESDDVVHTETIQKALPIGRSEIHFATSSTDVNVRVQMVTESDFRETTSGLPSLFKKSVPKKNTQVLWGNENLQFESDFSGTQANVFSSFWLRARTFFGFF
ncbi:hypothetical protein COU18_01115 [Candidatus Kaiserbacteria bacterium CG10_big_fil_rev_8_21_14_0_10_51_14]|uniref:Uncharacterized protein n=1 Tax=Candidatus Kaiserbacteria bacterium CG10_big_fil_rev_8_21_14_0_10_51_14 TaxID=1974610 RepID=A0A2H0UC66_9BACT|nr:MAG: hypothetical protein COU18_01115 [Candidatus Kaiserbacteria bacterium CG10_big_fil_rev_8_21_14_0_10_51_14]